MEDYTKKKLLSDIVSGNKFNIENFVSEVQGFSLGLRLRHWETKSYALHKAVEMTQEALDGLLDDFVEAFTGMSGGSRPKFTEKIKSNTDDGSFIKCLRELAIKDTCLLNIRDEMLQCIYKLQYLESLS